MNINAIYTDFWELLGTYLSSDDIYAFMLTCRQAFKACKRHSLRSKMSYPMLYPWRLTFEQRELVRGMEAGTQRFKLIHGDVGSGKTIVSTSYAIRNYASADSDPNAKVVMCGPPSLIKMWWSTLQKYFGIEPCVLHGTNTKYKATESWTETPTEKFILISYRLFGLHRNTGWFDPTRDLLIVDEAHHQTSIPFQDFKEVIGLSATTTKKSGLSKGIKRVLRTFDLKADECTYSLSKLVIARKLPPVEYYPYLIPLNSIRPATLASMVAYTRKGDYDLSCVSEISKLISHPIIQDLRTQFTAGFIMVGRKSMKVEQGYSKGYHESMGILREEEPGLNDREYRKKMVNRVTYDVLKEGVNYPKYVQVYHIIKNANDQGEKVLLFDMSVTYLPFLHKFLIGSGINSYIFSTHYDVTGRQRQLTKFKEDEKPGVLLSSISMLGEGQNVTEANHVIFLTHCLDHTKYYQAVGRCWRYPQKKTVKVHLVFGNNFERKVYEHACKGPDLKGYDWNQLM